VFEGSVHDGGPRPAFAPRVWLSAMQRKEPVASACFPAALLRLLKLLVTHWPRVG